MLSLDVWAKCIENADATPPHLEVFPAVGELSGFARFCADLCGEQLRACFHNAGIVVLVIVILLIPQGQSTFQCQDCRRTLSLT